MLETTEYPPGAPCWVDLNANDMAAAKDFYAAVFDWEAEDQTADGEIVYTVFRLDGKMVAGGAALEEGQPAPPFGWSVFFTVDDVDATLARSVESGAEVLIGAVTIEGVGRSALVADPTGAVFTLWQPDQHKGFEVTNVAGAPYWCDCNTRDAERAAAFYHQIFGWKIGPIAGPGDDWRPAELHGEQVAGIMQMGATFPPEIPPHWLLYIKVDDCDATAERIATAGGELTSPIMSVENMRFVVVEDPQDAVFAILQD